jgi:hypothetical protein
MVVLWSSLMYTRKVLVMDSLMFLSMESLRVDCLDYWMVLLLALLADSSIEFMLRHLWDPLAALATGDCLLSSLVLLYAP